MSFHKFSLIVYSQNIWLWSFVIFFFNCYFWLNKGLKKSIFKNATFGRRWKFVHCDFQHKQKKKDERIVNLGQNVNKSEHLQSWYDLLAWKIQSWYPMKRGCVTRSNRGLHGYGLEQSFFLLILKLIRYKCSRIRYV